VLIGDAAVHNVLSSGDVELVHPVKEGRICDWDAMEAMWAHVFERELCIDPSKQPVLISWSPGETKENAEKAVEMLFEKFDVPAVYLGVSPVLALYSSGINSGCVLESGDGATHACCVIEGFAYPAATVRSAVSGRSATVYLQELLRLRGHHFSATLDVMRIRDIKESICYCATEYDGEVKLAMERNRVSAVLPDGTVVYRLSKC
jgi:actin-related protein